MLELARRVERIDVHLDGAGADDSEEREREGGQVGQHHGDAVALFHAKLLLQIGSEVARQSVGIGVSERLAEAAKRGLLRITLHGLLEHLQHRSMGVGIDLGRNAPAIGGKPMFA